MRNALLFLTLISALIIGQSHSAFAKENPRYASIIIDADTGTILEQQRADKSLHPASLTKIMTLLMLFEAVDQGRVGLNDRIRISRHAANMVPSKLGLAPGASIKVKDAISILVTKSANDIAVAVAEHLGRTESGFAQLMNRKAIEIGMTRTTFKNASGLHDRRQVSTARDMAKLAQYVINAYPSYYTYFSRKSFTYAGKTYRSHNRLMSSYKGMDGMKTGYIAASGFNLVASAVRNNRRIIAVVFGGRTSKSRNAHMEVLLDRGFKKAQTIRIAKAVAPVPDRKPNNGAMALTAADRNAGSATPTQSQQSLALASIDPEIMTNFKELIGEGDYDLAMVRRIQTGLSAINAHQSQVSLSAARNSYIQKASIPAPTQKPKPKTLSGAGPWSIQVGAFNSRDKTDGVIRKTLKQLPKPYSAAYPIIAPLKTASGWLYRARISGYTQQEAYAACGYLKDCLPVAPQN